MNNAAVYTGPGTNYILLAIYSKDIELEVIGRDTEGYWLVVIIPPDQPGWLALANVEFTLNINDLPAMEPPPTPQLTATSASPTNIQIVISKWVNYGTTGDKEPDLRGYQITIYGLSRDEDIKIILTHEETSKTTRWSRHVNTADGIFIQYLGIESLSSGHYTITVQRSDGTFLQAYFLVDK